MNESDMTMEKSLPKEDKNKKLAMMDPSQISLIATCNRKVKDQLRLSKEWGKLVIESEEPGYNCREPNIEGRGTIYTMDYIYDFLKMFKKEATHVRLLVGKDKPLKMELSIEDYDGETRVVTFYLAPRIEPEEENKEEVKENADKDEQTVSSGGEPDRNTGQPRTEPSKGDNTPGVENTTKEVQ